MKFTEIAFTAYPAIDLAESRAFYESVLGLTPGLISSHDGEGGWVEYEIGNQILAIGKAPRHEPQPGRPKLRT